MDAQKLAELIALIPDQTKVRDDNRAAAQQAIDEAKVIVAKDVNVVADEGVAHHILNVLRAPQPSLLIQHGIADATLDDVVAILKAGA